MSCVRCTKVGSDDLWLGAGRQTCNVWCKKYGIVVW